MRKRAATIIMMVGIALAVVAGLGVFAMARQAKADRTAQVQQVLVVMASRDIAEGTAVTADSLTVQAFPADFVPHGAVAAPDDAIGKYTTTHVTKGQIVLSDQLSATLRAGNLSLSVPSGMVAVALPMTDLMSSNGAIKAGDHVDILLTIDLVEIKLQSAQADATPVDSGGNTNARNPVTQTTLQNVEVVAVGQAADDSSSDSSSATTAGSPSSTAKGAVIVSVNSQDALVLKYAKDSGGVVDLALRAPGDTQPVTTDPITIDRLFGRFNFQRPGPLP
jgi:pilus assembly protein CpaB